MAVLIPKLDPLEDWDNLPANHARILYNNLLTASTTSAAEKMLTPNTYERYLPPGGANTIKFQLTSSAEIDSIAIAGHNLGTHDGGVTIDFSYATTIGGGTTVLDSVTANVDNDAIMINFDPVTVAEIVITFTAIAGVEMAVIYAGKSLQMYQPIYGGHQPIKLNSKTEYQSNISETGQFLGRRIIKEGGETSYNYSRLDPDWYRERFQPFVKSAKKSPFFMQWRPDFYPDEVAYCQTTSDIKPTNMGGGHTLMSVSINVRSHDDV